MKENKPIDDNEPTLENLEDYDTLKGEKKRTVWIAIFAGLLIGAIVVGAKHYYSNTSETIPTEDTIGKVPPKRW